MYYKKKVVITDNSCSTRNHQGEKVTLRVRVRTRANGQGMVMVGLRLGLGFVLR